LTLQKTEWDIARQSTFSSFPKNELIKGKTSWSLWARFSVDNQTTAHQVFVLQSPKSGYATAYIQTDDTTYILKTGSLLPLAQRSIQANTNGFRVFIKTNDRATIWLRLQSVYSIYTPRNYDLIIKPEAEFIWLDNQRLLWQGIFLGVILIMSLYNFFIGVAVKDISYLYYVLSIVGIGTYFAFYYGFGIEYLWPKSPLWDTFCYLIIVPFSGLMRLLFTRTYLHTPQLLPNTNFLINILMGLSIFVMSFGLIAYLFKIDIILILIEIIGFTGTAIHLLMLIAVSLRTEKNISLRNILSGQILYW